MDTNKKPSPDTARILAHCEAQVKRHSDRTESTLTKIRAIIENVINDAYEAGKMGFVLTEEKIQNIVGGSWKAAKKLKERMRRFGIIVCLKKPTGRGEVAVWGLVHDFVKWPKKKKRAQPSYSTVKYYPAYYRLRETIKESLGKSYRDAGRTYDPAVFSKEVSRSLRTSLAEYGLTKDDLLRPEFRPAPATTGKYAYLKAVA